MTNRNQSRPSANVEAGGQSTDSDGALARADYIQDQLQQSRTAADHGEILRKRAHTRIAAAKAAIGSHPQGDEGAADLSQYHAVERMLDERAFYPPHDKRKESPAYAKMHHQMTVVDDKHCLVCGVQHSTLQSPQMNPFGAVAMETHHHTVEWALANAVDPAKFNKHVRPGLLRQAKVRQSDPAYAQVSDLYKAFDQIYESDMTADSIKQWVDHAADNLWVLCDVHHRHKFVGIHAITFPIWGPQDIVDETIVAKQIDTAKSTHSDV